MKTRMKVKEYLGKYKNVRNYKGLDADDEREYDVPDDSKLKRGPGRPKGRPE